MEYNKYDAEQFNITLDIDMNGEFKENGDCEGIVINVSDENSIHVDDGLTRMIKNKLEKIIKTDKEIIEYLEFMNKEYQSECDIDNREFEETG